MSELNLAYAFAGFVVGLGLGCSVGFLTGYRKGFLTGHNRGLYLKARKERIEGKEVKQHESAESSNN